MFAYDTFSCYSPLIHPHRLMPSFQHGFLHPCSAMERCWKRYVRWLTGGREAPVQDVPHGCPRGDAPGAFSDKVSDWFILLRGEEHRPAVLAPDVIGDQCRRPDRDVGRRRDILNISKGEFPNTLSCLPFVMLLIPSAMHCVVHHSNSLATCLI